MSALQPILPPRTRRIRISRLFPALVLAFAICGAARAQPKAPPARAAASPSPSVTAAAADSPIAATLDSIAPDELVARSASLAPALRAVYRDNRFAPLWTTPAAGPSAAMLHARLTASSLHGLAPADYRTDWIGEQLAALRDGRISDASRLARLDVTMTAALLRLLSDLREGRAAARQITGVWAPSSGAPGTADLLPAASDPDALRRLLDAAAPAYPIYRRLLRARAAYEALIAGRREAPSLPESAKIEPGTRSPIIATIAARLIELGDLPAAAIVADRNEGAVLEGEVLEAVRRFQGRHGLDPDGVVGKATLAALRTPNRQRLRQIDLALERLRWLPPLRSDRVIAINIPDFRLWAYGREPAGGPMRLLLESKVVVGRQGRTPTPVFIANLGSIDFAPYWNVPYSIARGEILPRLRRDPGYLEREEMEFVGGDGRTVSRDVSAANLAAVERGAMRIRQRPGSRNALGEVKFTMPNSMNIYLHDTPSRSLFAQSRRDFSHGCIRLEKPAELARYALAANPDWDEARIRLAMATARLEAVRLTEPIPVVVFYTTVTVDDDGTIRFLPDIYGQDRKLDAVMPAAS